MAKSSHAMRVAALSSMLVYVLGHRPDEFGLVPDSEGYFSLKELLKALHEDEDWRHVREAEIREVLLTGERGLFETDQKRIKARKPRWSPPVPAASPDDIPKILYAPVRRRAHPVVFDKGLQAPPGGFTVLSSDRAAAEQLGRRRDPDPVVLEITAAQAVKKGCELKIFGILFLVNSLPVEYIAGPPPPVQNVVERVQRSKRRERPQPSPPEFMPGGFALDPARDPDLQRRTKGRKPKGWKEEARRSKGRK